MRKEIKFRAWDKADEVMCDVTYLKFSKVQYMAVGYRKKIHGKSIDINSLLDENMSGTCVLMQYTGLHDKNGKEIYEGDILKRTLLPTRRITNLSTVKWISLKACLSSVDLDGSSVTFISDYINNRYELEVVGNIHENPELLDA